MLLYSSTSMMTLRCNVGDYKTNIGWALLKLIQLSNKSKDVNDFEQIIELTFVNTVNDFDDKIEIQVHREIFQKYIHTVVKSKTK